MASQIQSESETQDKENRHRKTPNERLPALYLAYASHHYSICDREVTVQSEGGEARWIPPAVIGSLGRMIDRAVHSSAEVLAHQRVHRDCTRHTHKVV